MSENMKTDLLPSFTGFAFCCGTLIALLGAGCSSPGSASDTGTGGTLGSGGQSGVKSSGGSTGSGGGVGSGGSAASGGTVGSGGSPASGGTVGTGGSAASGGTVGTGGSVSSGGSPASGGSVGTGGSVGNGGSVASGGSTGGSVSRGGSVGTGGVPGTGGGIGSGGSAGSGGGAGTGGTTGGKGGSTGTGGKLAGGAIVTGGAGGGGASGTGGGQPFKGIAGGACKVRTAMNVSWYYNWSGTENEACAVVNGVEYVPMIWGADTAANIQTAVAGFASKGSKYVLGFNEPDNTAAGGGSNITVASAIALLPAFDSVANIAVGTPGTQANTTGQAWFKEYMADVAANTALRADFIAIHWYGWNAGSCDAAASQLESYINYAESFPGNRPIWLTEWGCLNQSAPTAAGVIAFFNGALAVFAKHPRLARYAWYQWSPNCEVYNTDDTLTDLGQVYAAAPAKK